MRSNRQKGKAGTPAIKFVAFPALRKNLHAEASSEIFRFQYSRIAIRDRTALSHPMLHLNQVPLVSGQTPCQPHTENPYCHMPYRFSAASFLPLRLFPLVLTDRIPERFLSFPQMQFQEDFVLSFPGLWKSQLKMPQAHGNVPDDGKHEPMFRIRP